MRLIGLLDSPYVRRVAISLKALDIPFTHEPLSVFRAYDDFAAINPVVKAPSLVTDGGVVLMDSSLILEHLERLASPGRSLAPASLEAHARAQRIVGLALAACDKAVQILYEHNFRPEEKRHQPWLERVRVQLAAALGLLDVETAAADPWLFGERQYQADITSAVAWRFVREKIGDEASDTTHPRLAALSARAEATAEFQAFPTGLG